MEMYRVNGSWDDAYRVAKSHAGSAASKQVVYNWATSVGGEAGAKLLEKFGLVEEAIQYAMDLGSWDHAFELAHSVSCRVFHIYPLI